MPLTARLTGYRDPLDASQDDLGTGLNWDTIRGGHPRPDLRCPVCDGGMHAKQSPRGTRYFAHNPHQGHEKCPYRGAGETEEHVRLKRAIASEIRHAGWRATVEHSEPGWRADVLAINPAGSWRMAWEVQLSTALPEDLSDRTARYVADGVRVCWVTTKPRAAWLETLPSLLVQPHRSKRGNDLWMATRGYAEITEKPLSEIHAVPHHHRTRRAAELVGSRTMTWDQRYQNTVSGRPPWRTLLPEGIGLTEAAPVATDQFRANVTWATRRIPLYKFIGDLQKRQLLPVELAAPHRLVRRGGINAPVIVWTTTDTLMRAQALTAFAHGWPATYFNSPLPCCAGQHTKGTPSGAHQIALEHAIGIRIPLCLHCDPLAQRADELVDFEGRNPQNLPSRVAWDLTSPPLIYDSPTNPYSRRTP